PAFCALTCSCAPFPFRCAKAARSLHCRRGFQDWRRQRRRIEIAACTVRPYRSRAEPEMVFVHVVFAAGVLLQFLGGWAEHPRPRVFEWPGIKLRILDERLDVDVI